MAKSKGPKVYAVARGRAPGIYRTWGECEAQTKGFRGAIFKSFKTRFEAEAFVRANSAAAASIASAPSASASSAAQGRKRSRDRDSASNQPSKRAAQQQIQPSRKSNAQLHITIYFDGGSRGNPGVAGAGAEVVVEDRSMVSGIPPRKTTYSIREYCGERETNNYAEYTGLLVGLKKAKAFIEQYASSECAKTIASAAPLIPLFRLEVYGDSKLIIMQLRGVWQCKNANILPLYQQSGNLIAELRQRDRKSEIMFEHVYREHNTIADALANEAMDQRRSFTTSTGDNADNDSETDERKRAAVPVGQNKGGSKSVAQRTSAKPQNKAGGDVDESKDEYYC